MQEHKIWGEDYLEMTIYIFFSSNRFMRKMLYNS